MNRILASAAAALLACFALSAQAEIIQGPVLANHNTGWPNTGLQITALKNTTLTSFVFQNYGTNDTFELTSTNGTVLQWLSFAGSGTQAASTVNVDWALAANTSYDLVSTNPDNSKYSMASPVQDDELRVDGGIQLGGGLMPTLWFHFTGLTTDGAAPGGNVPEPGSVALLGLGIAGLAAARRRRV